MTSGTPTPEMDDSPDLDKIQKIVSEILESGDLGEPLGLPIGWILVISEWDPIRNLGYTSAVTKVGQPHVVTVGMLDEAMERLKRGTRPQGYAYRDDDE